VSDRHPEGVLPSVHELDLVCPACHHELTIEANAYHCVACKRNYGVFEGIPDFRLFADPYLRFHEDALRAKMVVSLLAEHSLADLLERYWSVSDITPAELRVRFIRSALLSEVRSERFLNALSLSDNVGRLLDVGSGTGGLLLAASHRAVRVVGVDIAMRWLQVSRRRFMDAGVDPPPLLCACAEALPFREGAFDRVTSVSTLEFTRDVRASISEAARVVSKNGTYLVTTVNRHSLSYDPYAYLRFVGFLPRSLQGWYVQWRKGTEWRIKEMSFAELDGALKEGFRRRDYQLPDVDDVSLQSFSASVQRQARLYRRAKRVPLLRRVLRYFGPGWEVLLREPIAKS